MGPVSDIGCVCVCVVVQLWMRMCGCDCVSECRCVGVSERCVVSILRHLSSSVSGCACRAVGQFLGKHYELYTGMPELKNMLSKCLGVVLRKSSNKQFINEHLALMFQSVNHANQIEREGAFPWCSLHGLFQCLFLLISGCTRHRRHTMCVLIWRRDVERGLCSMYEGISSIPPLPVGCVHERLF